MGEFGNATGAIRIADIFALRVFAKIYGLCNFRLLQHYPADNGHELDAAAFPKRANSSHQRRLVNGCNTLLISYLKLVRSRHIKR